MENNHLNSQEIALELTKIYAEHMNHRIDQKMPHSHIGEKHLATAYQYFYEAATFKRDLLSPKTENTPKSE